MPTISRWGFLSAADAGLVWLLLTSPTLQQNAVRPVACACPKLPDQGPEHRARGVETVHSGSKSPGNGSVENARSKSKGLTRLRRLAVSGHGKTKLLHAMQRAVLQMVGCRRPNDGFWKLCIRAQSLVAYRHGIAGSQLAKAGRVSSCFDVRRMEFVFFALMRLAILKA